MGLPNCWTLSLFLFLLTVSAASASSSRTATALLPMENRLEEKTLVVFSDLDGTLIHYPPKIPPNQKGNAILKLPPSSTGMRGVISSKTLSMVKQIRRMGGAKFVLVSGMRTSTFLNRLPYLPRADAYCTEAGGRIFYPTTVDSAQDNFIVKPKKYDGCNAADLEPFGIVEDMEWRKMMQEHAGSYGNANLKDLASNPSKVVPLEQRDGLLWDFARQLIAKGYVLDTKGYSYSFRVNKKQQKDMSDDEFEALTDVRLTLFDGLATSVNLSCVDFYPAISGKKNWYEKMPIEKFPPSGKSIKGTIPNTPYWIDCSSSCQYVAEKFCPGIDADTLLEKHTVCLCDDDNDIEMALACRHALMPEVTSQRLAKAVLENPDHFTQTGGEEMDQHGPVATEAALAILLNHFDIQSDQSN